VLLNEEADTCSFLWHWLKYLFTKRTPA